MHVRTPQRLQRHGLTLIGCRAFTWGPSIYDMLVVDRRGIVLAFVPQGERGLAAVNVMRQRYYVHRLVAYNIAAGLGPRGAFGNPRRLPWTGSHVHHRPDPLRPRQPPWGNSQRVNMIVWTRREHVDWHRAHGHVPH